MKKNGIFICIGIGILISAAVFWHLHAKSFAAKSEGSSRLQAPRMAFQPEVQMQYQSQQVDEFHATSTGPAAPAPAPASGAGYAYDRTICQTDPNRSGCLQKFYDSLVKKYGTGAAFQDMKRRFNDDPYAASICHPIMHVIGQAASRQYATISEAYLHGDSFCWSGYYHGIMEGVIAKIGPENLPKQLDAICADIPGKAAYNFDYYNCVHGLGHGIMELDHDEVFDALKMCDNLTGNWEQLSCYSGVYMENIIAEAKDHGSKFLKPSDPLYPCTAVENKYKDQCYLGQTSYALEKTNYNFSRVADLCATVAQPFRDTCFQSYGRDAANQAMHNAQATKATCWLPRDDNDKKNCVIGAAKEIISYYHSDVQSKAFCNILEGDFQRTCVATTETYYKNF